jgi:hypothetical protein
MKKASEYEKDTHFLLASGMMGRWEAPAVIRAEEFDPETDMERLLEVGGLREMAKEEVEKFRKGEFALPGRPAGYGPVSQAQSHDRPVTQRPIDVPPAEGRTESTPPHPQMTPVHRGGEGEHRKK